MHVAHLSLTDFRSYDTVDLGLEPGVTAFVGPNGQGKTNLVEALGYVATQSSHRVATDAPLVRHGASRAIVRSVVVRDDRRALVELEINPGRANRARLNRSPMSRPRDVIGLLRTVLFAPEDLALVKGDPSERRRFLDDLLVARAPRFAGVRADYDRVLKQRGALLRTAAQARRGSRSGRRAENDAGFAAAGAGDVLSTLEVWDAHLARQGAELLAARLELVEALRPLVAAAYASLAPGSAPASLEYRGTLSTGGDGVSPEGVSPDDVPPAPGSTAGVSTAGGQATEEQPARGPVGESANGRDAGARSVMAEHGTAGRGTTARPAAAQGTAAHKAHPAADRDTQSAAGQSAHPAVGQDAHPAAGQSVVDRGAIEQALRAALLEVRSAELERGVTLVGPHRDDLFLGLGSCPPGATPATASRGRSPWRSGWPPTSCSGPTAAIRC
nr:hypothetical protein GCM10020093_075980 [Planobispora longispora]